MAPTVIHWKKSLDQKESVQVRFEKWLFVNLSKVIIGGKTGELIRFKAPFFRKSLLETLRDGEKLSHQWGLEVFVLRKCHNCAHVIFYDSQRLEDALDEARKTPLLERLQYDQQITGKEFLEQLRHKWQHKGTIPHEIGIAAGYPVKDILGFMGLAPLPLTTVCGWQIYGDANPSLIMKERFDQAQRWAMDYIDVDQSIFLRDELRH
ncbi:DUF3793 family protein [Heliorestis convoluta]|uniref:DUF3793 family protein n=1 Tax=Heliorestis convoluta TaxID=356322 RepID=A0A5Q2N102_9FIRM|nr:DUF3793 family protein [Heliorestis convoluta]QGG48537.1 hypothetical protein FTV88_2440 [Heliorestis convoluta]